MPVFISSCQNSSSEYLIRIFKTRIKRLFFAYFLYLSFFTAADPYAEPQKSDEPKEAEALTENGKYPDEIDTYLKFMPYSSVDSMSGKVGIIKAGFEYDRTIKVFGRLPVDISVSYDYINIDKTVPAPLPVGLMDLQFTVETRVPLFNAEGFYVGIGLLPSFACDRESFGIGSFLFPFRAYLVYVVNDSLTLAGGAQFLADFDNSIAPVAGIIYKPCDRLTFNIVTDEPNITYKITDKVDVFAESDFAVFDQYKVKLDGDKDVKLEYNDLSVGGGLNFRPCRNIKTSVSSGCVFARRIKYPDAGWKIDIDKNIYVQGSIEASF